MTMLPAASVRNPKRRISFVATIAGSGLPRELRAPFVVQKLRCLAWLRQHAAPTPPSPFTSEDKAAAQSNKPKEDLDRLERIEAEYLRPPERGSW
jgi:hypothetical protein